MESKIIQPKIEIVDSIRLIGHIKATVIRANGERFVHYDGKNATDAALLALSAAGLQTKMDALFTASGTPGTSGKDGIAYNDPVAYDTSYMFQCTGTSPVTSFTLGWSGAAAARKLTGAFTGSVVVFATAAYIELGFNHDGIHDFASLYAHAGSWASLSLAAADVVVIEWTITFA